MLESVFFSTSVRFLGLLCLGVAAGIAACIFFAERAWVGSGAFYTELMQLFIRALTIPGPVLGALGLVAMVVDAGLLLRRGGSEGTAFWLVVGAVVLSLAALAITRLGHFPINDQIRTWDPAHPPADWRDVQARWSALHVARTLSAVASFALFVSSNLVRK